MKEERRGEEIECPFRVLACAVWKSSDWSVCSVSCGEGTQERRIHCTRNGSTVNEINCDKVDRDQRSFLILPSSPSEFSSSYNEEM